MLYLNFLFLTLHSAGGNSRANHMVKSSVRDMQCDSTKLVVYARTSIIHNHAIYALNVSRLPACRRVDRTDTLSVFDLRNFDPWEPLQLVDSRQYPLHSFYCAYYTDTKLLCGDRQGASFVYVSCSCDG